MSNGRLTRRRVWVLVKAYPQPSKQYGETVCCAGIDDDTREFVRLYPIRYRQLPPELRFDRFDLIEAELFRPTNDTRPESFKVREESLQIRTRGKDVNARSKVQLWLPAVSQSLETLQAEQRETGKSLGIIRPDPGSVRFRFKPLNEASTEERDAAQSMRSQQLLLEDTVKPLAAPDYVFSYTFTSGGKRHSMQLHDWEVQAAYFNYRRRYGTQTLTYLQQEYEERIPAQNLHLLMGTQAARRWQFMIIGLLRTTEPVDELSAQGKLF